MLNLFRLPFAKRVLALSFACAIHTAANAQSRPAAPAVAVQVAAPLVAVPSPKIPVAIAATPAAPVLSTAATPKPKKKRSPRRPLIDDGF